MNSKTDHTKQFIIERTADIFNAKGYAGTSINDITNATGLSKGSVYGNFANKDEVALAVFDYNFGRVVSYLRNEIEKRNGSIEKLMVYPDTYRKFLTIPFLKTGCPVLNASTDADDTHELLKAKVSSALKMWRKSIEHHVNSGIKSDEIKADVNAADFAIVLMSLVEGSVMQAKISGKSTELNITMNFLESMINGMRS